MSKDLNITKTFKFLYKEGKGFEETVESILTADHLKPTLYKAKSLKRLENFNEVLFNHFSIMFYSENISIKLFKVQLFNLHSQRIEYLCNKISGLAAELPKRAQKHKISIIYSIKPKESREGSLLIYFDNQQISDFTYALSSDESLASLQSFTSLLVFALVEIIQSSILEVISFSIVSASSFRIDEMLTKNSNKDCLRAAKAIIENKLTKYNQQKLSTEPEGSLIKRSTSNKQTKILKLTFPTLRFFRELNLFKAAFRQNFTLSKEIPRGNMTIKV